MWHFLGIGAQRSGTTWLYHHLSKHPEIGFPGGKEVHYWDWLQAGYRSEDHKRYLSLFSDPFLKEGDMTPAYAILEQRYIAEISELNPQLRIIFIMRNPIERAWSAALMGLRRLQMRFEEASEQWFIDVFRSEASLARGDYAATLQRWHKFFPKDHVLLLSYEELRSEPRKVLMKAARHMGIDPDFFKTLSKEELQCRVNHPSLPGGERLPPPSSLQKVLSDIYQEKILALEEYLSVDLSHWRKIAK